MTYLDLIQEMRLLDALSLLLHTRTALLVVLYAYSSTLGDNRTM